MMKFSYRIVCLSSIGVALIVLYAMWIRWIPANTVKQNDDVQTSVWHASGVLLKEEHVTDQLDITSGKLSESRVMRSTYGVGKAKTDIATIDLLSNIGDYQMTDLERPESKTNVYSNSDDEIVDLPLKVIVVPHSHNDPGWHKTVDLYFKDQTRPTLDYMLEKLQQFPNMSFVWAETVFLSMWWDTLNGEKRQALRRLLKRGQLEIVGGGWVVPDEATTHYFALIDQLMEGHQWLHTNLEINPTNTWSLDPFGYSEFLPYLYKQSGFQNAVILRIHAKVKEHLQKEKALEFIWRQSWDIQNITDFMTLVMPYMLYNIKHSCGPDPDICVKYDFRKIAGEISDSRAEVVNSGNVDRLSKQLLGQYRKKAKLFQHNVVLVPLGDDFRFDREIEWDQQFKNYMQLFNHMNRQVDWNVQARFGTVKDYFDEVHAAMLKLNHIDLHSLHKFPTLSGDFFPYTDREDEYWTGYYTTRPFIKGVSRDLEVYLRSAEILHTLSNIMPNSNSYDRNANYIKLTQARRNLALFQHHDGITGTCRSWVADDYEKRLFTGLLLAREVIGSAGGHLLNSVHEGLSVGAKVLEPLSIRLLSPNKHVIHIKSSGKRLVIFNNVAHHRRECIHLAVNKQFVRITDGANHSVVGQISPLWLDGNKVTKDLYMLSFIVDLPPLGMVSYDLTISDIADSRRSEIAVVKLHNSTRVNTKKILTVDNGYLRATFSQRNGFLRSLEIVKSNHSKKVDIRFMMYTSRRSGAYIFAPVGPALEIINKQVSVFHVIRGPVFSEVRVSLQFITHSVRLINSSCPLGVAVEINNIVDLTNFNEKELVMRLNTDILSTTQFYTDQNGFNTVERRRFARLPREANFYPSTSIAFIEDERSRLSLIMSQPFGTSSQLDGELEVMLDRRLQYDDNRGLGEGIQDNRPVFSRFYVLLEKSSRDYVQSAVLLTSPSLGAHILVDHLRNQPIILLTSAPVTPYKLQLLPLRMPLSCETVLVNMRSLNNNSNSAAIVFYRQAYNDVYSFSDGDVNWDCDVQFQDPVPSHMFSDIQIKQVYETSLSLMYKKRQCRLDEPLGLNPMNIHCYQFDFA